MNMSNAPDQRLLDALLDSWERNNTLLLLQHMLWHEGYHHGQIKLALKVAGRPMTNEVAGPLTWRVWMRKK